MRAQQDGTVGRKLSRLARIEREAKRILGSLADRGEAQLGSLLYRTRQKEVGLRLLALREQAERTGVQAMERLDGFRERSLGRLGVVTHRELLLLESQLRGLTARLDALAGQERLLRVANHAPLHRDSVM